MSKQILDAWKQKSLEQLSSKQISVRLRVGIDQRINKLLKQYPDVNRTDVINDLLDSALTTIKQ